MSTKALLRLLRYFQALLGFVLTIMVAYIVMNSFLITTFRVDGQSMMPTLRNRELLLINLMAYTFAPPQQDDMVIVAYEGDSKTHFVKRIVGTPGNQVEFKGEQIFLAPDEYFVVGDNRDHSTDSRAYGPIKKDQLVGKVVHVF